jgi:anti-sigma factor RsiW
MATCREISDALSRHLDGEASPAERARVDAHLAACRACREEAQALGRVDAAAQRAFAGHPFDAALARRISEAAARQRTPSGRVRPEPKIIEGPWARLRRGWPAAAAAALLLTAGLAIRAGFRSPERPAPGGAAPLLASVRALESGRVRVARGGIGDVSYVAPGGELGLRAGDVVLAEARGGEIAFADGSRVLVRPDTRVAVRAAEGREGVEILGGEGELYCEVAHQRAGERFQVETGAALVDVVGTRFGVRLERGAAIATVLEGTVRVTPTAGGEAVLLSKDERARTLAAGGARVERVRARAELVWALGKPPVESVPPAPSDATPTPPPSGVGAPTPAPGGDEDLPVRGPR